MAGEVTALGKKCRAAILLIEHIVQLLPKVLPLYLRARVAASLDQRSSSLKGATLSAEFRNKQLLSARPSMFHTTHTAQPERGEVGIKRM